jgi:prophage regulatory protein
VQSQSQRLVREAERRQITGLPTSTWYEHQKQGLAPPPVKLSASRVAWPLSELNALNNARIAGRSDDEIRQLVAALVADRRDAAA